MKQKYVCLVLLCFFFLQIFIGANINIKFIIFKLKRRNVRRLSSVCLHFFRGVDQFFIPTPSTMFSPSRLFFTDFYEMYLNKADMSVCHPYLTSITIEFGAWMLAVDDPLFDQCTLI